MAEFFKDIPNHVGLYSQIINCCKNRQKTSGGFIWKYREEI